MSEQATGRLIGIAHRPAHRAPMQTVESALIAEGGGVEGDHKGQKFPRRGVTILAREAWEAALADLAETSARGRGSLDRAAGKPSRRRRGAAASARRHRAHRPSAARGHLSDDAVQTHGRSPRWAHACALPGMARRRNLPCARGRARCDRRPGRGASLAARAQGPLAGLSRATAREQKRVQRPGHCTLDLERHPISPGCGRLHTRPAPPCCCATAR